MLDFEDQKENLIQKLSEQYSRNVISMGEYERILEYINKIESEKEINIIEKIIRENNVQGNELTAARNGEIPPPGNGEKHLSMFSWRNTSVRPVNGSGGKYTSLFGANRIIVDKLPRGRTVINVNSIFGLVEIIVPENIKIINRAVPVFSGIFTPNEIHKEDGELPELYIAGKAVFGNITVKKIRDFEKEQEREKELADILTEKINRKIIDKFKSTTSP